MGGSGIWNWGIGIGDGELGMGNRDGIANQPRGCGILCHLFRYKKLKKVKEEDLDGYKIHLNSMGQ
jgi:hypothetical protein